MEKLIDLFYKVSKNSSKWDSYFDVYEKHLSQFRGKAPRILEIGILEGGSIELWHKYFGEGTQITALDVNPQCKTYQYDFPVEIVIGDQSSEEFWKNFFTTHDNYDIIIDDGGHTMLQQIVTLKNCFPYLNDRGFFITEDTHTSYWSRWGGAYKGNSFQEYSKHITDFLNIQHFDANVMPQNERDIFAELYSVSFYNSLVLFEKRKNQTFINITSFDNRK